jgi:Replication-relaxation
MFVQALRLASGLQLQRVFWPARPDVTSASTARAARRTLRRLADWRVLDPLPDRAMGGRRGGSQSYHWHVGPAGLRLLDRLGAHGKRLVAPTDRHVRHTIGITETVVRLIEADRAGTLECIAWEGEPTCWRGYVGAGAQRLTLRPDLFVRLGSGAFELRLFVEYDLATESPQTVLGKLERHLLYRRSGAELRDHGVDPKVVWIVPDARRAAVLQRLIDGLDTRDRALFAVTTQDEATRWLASEAQV